MSELTIIIDERAGSPLSVHNVWENEDAVKKALDVARQYEKASGDFSVAWVRQGKTVDSVRVNEIGLMALTGFSPEDLRN